MRKLAALLVVVVVCLAGSATAQEVAGTTTRGFNPTNATASLQAAIRSGARRVVVLNIGQPWIVDPVFLESDQELIFEAGTVVEVRRGGFKERSDSLFTAGRKERIVIPGYGAIWRMHKDDHARPLYQKAEARHGLRSMSSSRFTVEGVTIERSAGDGVFIGRRFNPKVLPGCRDVVIHNVTCTDDHPQGISVISVENLLIENHVSRGTKGMAPQAGIDFEPNPPDEVFFNCVVHDCVIEKGRGAGVLVNFRRLTAASSPLSVTIENCQIRSNRCANVMVERCRGTDQSGGYLRSIGRFIGRWRRCRWPERFTLEFVNSCRP